METFKIYLVKFYIQKKKDQTQIHKFPKRKDSTRVTNGSIWRGVLG